MNGKQDGIISRETLSQKTVQNKDVNGSFLNANLEGRDVGTLSALPCCSLVSFRGDT